jgi:hypothetical protein
MIRVYFVYEDPLDETGVNLSYVDVPTQAASNAVLHVQRAAESGELWRSMYPVDDEHPYKLIKSHMSYLDISGLANVASPETILPI